MPKLTHWTKYINPLLESEKFGINVTFYALSIIIFGLFYISSLLLDSSYDDPALFKPNENDYFRTFLLGFIAPFIYVFIMEFVLSVESLHASTKAIIDFVGDDLIQLLFIFFLAHPQRQEQDNKHIHTEGFWHIIPKQSFIFGVSWSIGQLCVWLFKFHNKNLSELPLQEHEETNGLDEGLLRDSINSKATVANCTHVRRSYNSVAKNVYCTENYGSTENDTLVLSPDDTVNFLVDLQRQQSITQNLARESVPVFTETVPQMILATVGGLTSFILMNVSQAMLSSMYFIYVPTVKHKKVLFTKLVILFGSGTFVQFFLELLLPVIVVNCVVFILLLNDRVKTYWKPLAFVVFWSVLVFALSLYVVILE